MNTDKNGLVMVALVVSATLAAGQGIPTAAPPKAPATSKSALDKKTLEDYLRHLELWTPQVQVQIADPKPSSMPEFVQVDVHASMGQAFQDNSYLVSKDGKRILKAMVYDVAENPFKPDLTKLKTEFSPSLGTPGASVVLVMFSDFQCGYCREEAKMLRENLVKTFPTQARLYFKDYPLMQIHPWAKTAAMAGRCVFRGNPTAFWDYSDWAFANQATLTPETFQAKFLEYAQSKGLDAASLGKCLESRATEREVDRSIAEAKALNITGTPTLFINGRRLSTTIPWPNLQQIIQLEIEYQKTAKNAGEDCGCDVTLPSLTGPSLTGPSPTGAKP